MSTALDRDPDADRTATPQAAAPQSAAAPQAAAPEAPVRTHRPVRHTHTLIVLAVGVALWLYVGVVGIILLRNGALGELWIMLGAAVVPGTLLWIMTHRLLPQDTLTPARIVITAAIGGPFALALAGTFDALVGMNPAHGVAHEAIPLALAGVVEELCKGVLIVVLGWKVAKTTRNGLFIGGAVGIGFAVIETMFYIDEYFTGPAPVLDALETVLVRGVLSPFGHPLWSALLGAAIFAAASKTGRYRLTFGVLGAYLLVAVLHGVFDGGADVIVVLTRQPLFGFLGFVFPLLVAVAGALIWRTVAHRANIAVGLPPRPSAIPKAAPVPARG